MNPWGRDMPKPDRPPRLPLKQVVVRDKLRGGKEVRFGPAAEDPLIPETLCAAIQGQIALGRETRLFDPVVVTFTADIGKLPLSPF